MDATAFPNFTTLLIDVQTHSNRQVVHLQFNRPASKNAMTFEMAEEFTQALVEIARLPHLAAVILSGTSGTFCSGGDLSWLAESGTVSVAELRQRMRTFYDAFLGIGNLPVPTIAAIDGAAIGAGMAVAAAADLRVVAQDAKVGAPFTHLGLHPGMATTFNLPRLLGDSMARDVLLTGRLLDGTECLAAGFASRTAESGQAVTVAQKMARRIAGAAPLATDLTLQGLRTGAPSQAAALAWEAVTQPVTMQSVDAAEGLAAAAEKRRPEFRGQ